VAVNGDAGRLLPVRLDGRAGRSVRVLWTAMVVVVAALGTGGFVQVVREPELISLQPAAELFAGSGFGLLTVALLLVAPAVASLGLCVVVWRRRPDDAMALLFSGTLLLMFTLGSRTLLAWRDVAGLRHAFPVTGALMWVGLAAVVAVFPDGRAVPRPARWLPLAMALVFVAFPDAVWLGEAALQGELTAPRRFAAAWGPAFGLLLLGAGAQVHRHRRTSGPVEKQQARWAMGPLAVMLLLVGVALVVSLLGGDGARPVLGGLSHVTLAIMTAVPFAVGNAVLRHRLWDLDRVVSRTVTYSVVVVVLGALYAATVTLLGSLVSGLRGEPGEDLAVAASVLLVAALFQPLRARVRTAVDRRFDRTGTERRQVLEDLTNDLRHRTDLDAIRLHVEHTTDHLVRPTHVDLWLARRTTDG
jgi:hypothetical protein